MDRVAMLQEVLAQNPKDTFARDSGVRCFT